MLRRLLFVGAALLLSACAGQQDPNAYGTTTKHFTRTEAAAQAREQFMVYDPIEPANRRIYKFNAKFDKYVFLPVVDAYNFVVPDYVDDRFSSFFSNIGEFRNATNSLLQGRVGQGANAVGRFAVNTTVGLLGFYDPATHMGLKPRKADFGQTLHRWGLGTGAYVVLPVLGPSNARDTVGMVVDALTFSFVMPNHIEDDDAYMITQYGVKPVNTRANQDFRYHGTGSPFEYELLRFITSETRRLEMMQ